MAKAKAKQEEQDERDLEQEEMEVIEMMTTAQQAADKIFGEKSNLYAVHEICDHLRGGADPDDFGATLSRLYEAAKAAHNTDKPTPEMVFGLFERIFVVEYEGEE